MGFLVGLLDSLYPSGMPRWFLVVLTALALSACAATPDQIRAQPPRVVGSISGAPLTAARCVQSHFENMSSFWANALPAQVRDDGQGSVEFAVLTGSTFQAIGDFRADAQTTRISFHVSPVNLASVIADRFGEAVQACGGTIESAP